MVNRPHKAHFARKGVLSVNKIAVSAAYVTNDDENLYVAMQFENEIKPYGEDHINILIDDTSVASSVTSYTNDFKVTLTNNSNVNVKVNQWGNGNVNTTDKSGSENDRASSSITWGDVSDWRYPTGTDVVKYKIPLTVFAGAKGHTVKLIIAICNRDTLKCLMAISPAVSWNDSALQIDTSQDGLLSYTIK